MPWLQHPVCTKIQDLLVNWIFFRPRVSSNLGLKRLLIFLVQKSEKLCHFSQMSTKFKKEWNTIFFYYPYFLCFFITDVILLRHTELFCYICMCCRLKFFNLQSSSKVLRRLPFLPLLFLPPSAPGPMLIKTLMFVRVIIIVLLYPNI